MDTKYDTMQRELDAVEDLEHDESLPVSIWLSSLEAYNSGYLVGRWVSLPTDEDALQKAIDIVTQNGQHDYFIADRDGYFSDLVKEYTDPLKLNESMAEIEDLDVDTWETISFLVEDGGYDLTGAIDGYEAVYSFDSWEDAINDYIENSIRPHIPNGKTWDYIEQFIDRDEVKNRIEFSGNVIERNGRIIVIPE